MVISGRLQEKGSGLLQVLYQNVHTLHIVLHAHLILCNRFVKVLTKRKRPFERKLSLTCDIKDSTASITILRVLIIEFDCIKLPQNISVCIHVLATSFHFLNHWDVLVSLNISIMLHVSDNELFKSEFMFVASDWTNSKSPCLISTYSWCIEAAVSNAIVWEDSTLTPDYNLLLGYCWVIVLRIAAAADRDRVSL